MTVDSVQFLTDNYSKLTHNEQLTVDYIMTHLNSAMEMSVQELAMSVGVSPAVPVRLAQHLGFDGYKEFRLYMAKYRPEHSDIIFDIKQSLQSVPESVERVLISEIDSLQLTLGKMDYKNIMRIAELMKKSKQILFFGVRTSYLVCEDSVYKFQRIGKLAHCADDVTAAAVIMSSFEPEDMVIGISHSGETEATCRILSLAQEMGLRTVGVTTFPDSTICTNSDFILQTQTRESPLHKIALTSRISQFATMDALFMTYFTSDYDDCKEHMDKVYSNLQKLWKK